MGKPNKPVAGPRFDEEDAAPAFTLKSAEVLADAWVSEKNRLSPGFESAHDPRDDQWMRSRSGRNVVLLFVDVLHNVADWFTRRAMRRSVGEDLGIPDSVRRRLRIAFDAAWSDPRVQAKHDAEQRAHLARVLYDTARDVLG